MTEILYISRSQSVLRGSQGIRCHYEGDPWKHFCNGCFEGYSRSKIREVAVKNTTVFVGTIIYQLHVSALIGHLQVGIQLQRKISIISIGMGGRDLVYKYGCKRDLVPPYLYL